MIELTDTTSSAIAAEFVRARRKAGSPAMGMVMTLVVVVAEDKVTEAMESAQQASFEHPARVLGVILGSGRGAAMINAQVGTGDGWTGEVALIRLSGPVVKHPESVVLPLLLPDSPVVVWWAGTPPKDPGSDPLGQLAQRRITDVAAATRGRSAALLHQCREYAPGSTDLAWTRLTPWRALLAAALDVHQEKVQSASVTAERISPVGRPAGRLAGFATSRAGVAPHVLRARDHQGRARDEVRPDQDPANRRATGHPVVARSARPAGCAEAAHRGRVPRGGAAAPR